MKKPSRSQLHHSTSSSSSNNYHDENNDNHFTKKSSVNNHYSHQYVKHFEKSCEDLTENYFTTTTGTVTTINNSNNNCNTTTCYSESTIGFENKFTPIECFRYGKYSPLEAYSIDMHLKYLNIFASVQGSTIYIWKFGEKSRVIHMIEQKQMEYYCIRWGRWKDMDILAVGGSAQFISLYQIEFNENFEMCTSRYLASLNGHGNSVNCICFHPKMNGLILTGSTDHSIRLWDLNLNFETVAIFQSHLAGVISLSFHMSGDYFVSGAMDNTCRIFKIDDRVKNYIKFQKRYHELENIQSNNNTISNSDNNIYGGKNRIVFTQNCTCNTDIHPIKVPIIKSSIVYLYHRGYVDSCLFLGDVILSKTTSSESSTNDPGDSVIVWKPDCVNEESGFNVNGEEDEISIVHRFKGNQSYFWWLKMAISDKYLARPLHDGRVELFSFEHVALSFYSRPCAVLYHSSELVRECIFSRDSKYLFVLQSNGKITRWQIQ